MNATGLPTALSRSLLLLEAAARGDGLLFQDAIAALGAVPSTVSRLLRALTAADLLVHGDDGRYRAAPRLHRFATAVAAAPDLASEADAAAQTLSAATGESVAVFAPVDDGIKIIAKHDADERFRYRPVGSFIPRCDRHGAVMLRAAWWDEATAKRRLAEVAPGMGVRPWLRRLRAARRQGWIVNQHEDQPGITRVAATVLDAEGGLVAIVCVSGTSAAVDAGHDRILGEVRATAAALAARLAKLPA